MCSLENQFFSKLGAIQTNQFHNEFNLIIVMEETTTIETSEPQMSVPDNG
jgi:hypothetical protein